jgi:hypothetical protein
MVGGHRNLRDRTRRKRGGTMTRYRVSVWATIDVTADNEDDAIDTAHDAILDGEIRMRDYEFTTEEIEEQ